MHRDLTPESIEKAAGMLKAIAHPLRIAIVDYLEDGGQSTVTEIHRSLGIGQSAASHHLNILKNKGVLLSRREGKNTLYFLKHESLRTLLDCMSHCCK